MSKVYIANPHDSFFKEAVSDINIARDLLKAYLDADIQKMMQWETLRMSDRSFIDEQLHPFYSDMVYTAQIDNGSAQLYIVIEHQSTPDPMLAFRFQQYNYGIIRQYVKQNKGRKKIAPFPVITNLCIYSGKQSPYPYSLDIFDYFQKPKLARAQLCRPTPVADIATISEVELVQHGSTYLLELLLKQSAERTFFQWIKEHAKEVQALFLRYHSFSWIHYILAAESKYTSEEIIEALIEVVPHKKETIMTAAQQLETRGEKRGIRQGIQQGMQQGMERGMQQGIRQEKLHIAKNMLYKLHLDTTAVSKVTGLSQAELSKLRE